MSFEKLFSDSVLPQDKNISHIKASYLSCKKIELQISLDNPANFKKPDIVDSSGIGYALIAGQVSLLALGVIFVTLSLLSCLVLS